MEVSNVDDGKVRSDDLKHVEEEEDDELSELLDGEKVVFYIW